MIVGLTGSIASGKGVVSDFLKKKGFVYLSLSDELREIAKEKKIELTRKNLQDLGNLLREEQGTEFLAKSVYNKILNQQYLKAIIDGIRNPAEAIFLKKNLDDYFLISVDAPTETRFQRVKERNRESDPKTLEEFLKVDARDKGFGEKETGQGVKKCMDLADFTLINDGSLEEVQKSVEKLYNEIEIKIGRPTWDEYFLKIAAMVAERSTCRRHHVGAVIVKNKRILTTGYNGAAIGKKDCLELGCNKDKLGIASGFGSEECRGVHAEENAIVQASIHGVKVKDTTLYITHTPCRVCAKSIVQVGIKKIITYQDFVGDKGAKAYLEDSKIEIIKLPRPKSTISFKD